MPKQKQPCAISIATVHATIKRAIDDANKLQAWAARADDLITLPEVNSIREIETRATGLCEQWGRVVSILRTQQKRQQPGALTAKVRKVLGFKDL